MTIPNDVLANMRQEYKAKSLTEKESSGDPFKQFGKWFNEAVEAQLQEPNAMTLATVGPNNRPSARIVLLKGFDEMGFCFYTNYLSRKGKEISKNPFASIVFYWGDLERQVRIEGKIEKLSKERSEAYFHTRPVGSQLGAVVSPQSQLLPDRMVLEKRLELAASEYEGKVIPKPAHWGGYRVVPFSVEFWQGRPNRLHDRLEYVLMEKGKWKIQRLAP